MHKPMMLCGGVAVDDRGSVSYVNDLDGFKIKRFYEVRNHSAGFIRAWHGHKKEAKLVKVIQGAALVMAMPIDIFRKWEFLHDETSLLELNISSHITRVVLSEKHSHIYCIPPGYFNGFKTLTPDTIVQFFSTSTLEESAKDDIRVTWTKPNRAFWDINYR